jgi:hypothetical protein
LADSRSHKRSIVESLLPQAKNLVSEGERRLAAQEARVAELERAGRDAVQSKKLLKIMRETIELQKGYVRLLQREIQSE